MRILLSEGSGLTSRQVAGRLGELGHEVEILSSTALCLTRFTRHVRAVHRVPRFGRDPFGWCDAAARIARERGVDLLFPTQEQVTILAARRDRLGVATVVPDFAAVRRVQDKISAFRTLDAIGVPQPPTVVVARSEDLARVTAFPAFVKLPVSTASSGVRRVTTATELTSAARALGLGATELIVQTGAEGPLAMVQAVADRGRLVAHHANLRVREGVGGGAALKESVALDGLRDLLARLTGALGWHGGLSLDVIVTAEGLRVIDVNPRLVEPANAWASGVDLVGAMLALARGAVPVEQAQGRAGVRTRQTLLAVLGAAEHGGTRHAVLREAHDAILARGVYAGSREELTPVAGDPLAATPVALALIMSLAHPRLWRWFHTGTVDTYAVSPQGWQAIVAEAERDQAA
jgi:glutathione synthase/RimK-type ligase-like ATP-grasp enzyme